MTCKDCASFGACDDLAFHSSDYARKMGMIEFWDNAEERCENFKRNIEQEVQQYMRLVLGAELEQVRKNIACPQFGDEHYGPWGSLNLNQRCAIARMIETIRYLDKALEEKTRWLHVDERLPETDDQYYLVVVSGKCENVTLRNAIELAYYSKSEGWILEMWPLSTDLTVSHWMPLPSPPLEEKPK